MTLKVNEIFYSIHGEGTESGKTAVFIRFAGCNFRCLWCDTSYAFEEGTEMTEEDILKEIKKYPENNIVLTGGEPFTQNLGELLLLLKQKSYTVHVETNGSIFKPQYLNLINYIVVSPKGPSSGIKTDFDILDKVLTTFQKGVRPITTLKIVVGSLEDYDFAKKIYAQYPNIPLILQLESKNEIQKDFAKQIIELYKKEDGFFRDKTRIGIQLHKQIWGNKRGV